MTTYRAGQRVRIDLHDGSAVEATVKEMNGHAEVAMFGRMVIYRLNEASPGTRVTVLSEPRPDYEPNGLGAVVEAREDGGGLDTRRTFVRDHSGWWEDSDGQAVHWADLIDPVVLHEGWTP